MTGQRISRRPYLLRAMHQWMTDSALTPQILVDATHSGAEVPQSHVRDGRIALNLSYDATRHLDIGNEWLTFEARFGGVARSLRIPLEAIESIYARETGEGIVFPPEGASPTPTPTPTPEPSSPSTTPGARRPSLKIVK